MGSVIIGLGGAAPDPVLDNSRLESFVQTSDAWIVERTGIRERRVAPAGESSSTLGAKAAREALGRAGLSAGELDGIIVATMTPDMLMPNTACLIQMEIGATRAFAFDLSAACSGFLYALTVADSMIRAGSAKTLLVVGVDLISRITDYHDRGTCILFGDGGGAAVLTRGKEGQGILSSHLRADGTGWRSLYAESGGAASLSAPKSGGELDILTTRDSWPVPKVRMNGKEVFKWAVRVSEQAVRTEMERNGLRAEDIGLLVPHQANLRIIRAIQEKIGLRDDQTFVNIDRYGNISAGSIPLALHEAAQAGRIRKDDIVILVAMGGGLTWGAMTIRW